MFEVLTGPVGAVPPPTQQASTLHFVGRSVLQVILIILAHLLLTMLIWLFLFLVVSSWIEAFITQLTPTAYRITRLQVDRIHSIYMHSSIHVIMYHFL